MVKAYYSTGSVRNHFQLFQSEEYYSMAGKLKVFRDDLATWGRTQVESELRADAKPQ
jgi:hypothetical protein